MIISLEALGSDQNTIGMKSVKSPQSFLDCWEKNEAIRIGFESLYLTKKK